MSKEPTTEDIWKHRDAENPRRAREFRTHHPGAYSRRKELDDNEAIEIELNRRESLGEQIRTQGSLKTL